MKSSTSRFFLFGGGGIGLGGLLDVFLEMLGFAEKLGISLPFPGIFTIGAIVFVISVFLACWILVPGLVRDELQRIEDEDDRIRGKLQRLGKYELASTNPPIAWMYSARRDDPKEGE